MPREANRKSQKLSPLEKMAEKQEGPEALNRSPLGVYRPKVKHLTLKSE